MLHSKNSKEYILCAAIHFQDGNEYNCQPKNITSGFVVLGRRHFNCFNTCANLIGNTSYLKHKKIQGFITNWDRFVDRIEGRQIAIDADQVNVANLKHQLFSEDLY